VAVGVGEGVGCGVAVAVDVGGTVGSVVAVELGVGEAVCVGAAVGSTRVHVGLGSGEGDGVKEQAVSTSDSPMARHKDTFHHLILVTAMISMFPPGNPRPSACLPRREEPVGCDEPPPWGISIYSQE
jgi:hypothetical protein